MFCQKDESEDFYLKAKATISSFRCWATFLSIWWLEICMKSWTAFEYKQLFMAWWKLWGSWKDSAFYSDVSIIFFLLLLLPIIFLLLLLFLAILLLAGLFNSIIAAVIGAIWVAGRVIYSVGYYSGVPNNRIVGSLVSQFCQQGKSVACKYNKTKNKSIFQCLYFQVFHTCDQIFMWHFRRNWK